MNTRMYVSFLAVVLALTLSVPAVASTTSTITTAAPRHAGDITVSIFVCADPECTHGVPCDVTVTITPADIAAELTAAQKAAKIEAAINGEPCGVNVVRTDNVLTITNPPNGQEITAATDATGEVMLADNDGIGVPVTYITKAKLIGGTTGEGTARFGENEESHTVVTTTADTINDIYQKWADAFGEGTYDEDGFVLPRRVTVAHGFDFEVTDPGLTIEVTQETERAIPTVSQWGLIVMGVLTLTVGAIVLGRSRRRAVA